MKFYFAPLADISTPIYRAVCYAGGADICYSEMISAKAVVMKNRKTIDLATILPEEKQTFLQLFGAGPSDFYEATKILEQTIHPAGFDINVGCPVKKVIKGGAGSALMATPEVLRDVIAATRKATELPLSVKIRKGFIEPNYREIAHIAQEEGADLLVVHPRLRGEMFSGVSDFSVSIELAEMLSIPVIHSGDINDTQAVAQFDNTEVAGLMIGRASFGHPWIFRQLQGMNITENERKNMINMHFSMILESNMHEKVKMITIKKHASWYASGRRGATHFRQELFEKKKTVKEAVKFVSSFLDL